MNAELIPDKYWSDLGSTQAIAKEVLIHVKDCNGNPTVDHLIEVSSNLLRQGHCIVTAAVAALCGVLANNCNTTRELLKHRLEFAEVSYDVDHVLDLVQFVGSNPDESEGDFLYRIVDNAIAITIQIAMIQHLMQLPDAANKPEHKVLEKTFKILCAVQRYGATLEGHYASRTGA